MLWVLLSRAEGWLRQEKRARRGTALLLHWQVAMGVGRTLCEAGGQVYIIAKMCSLSSELPGFYFCAACAK